MQIASSPLPRTCEDCSALMAAASACAHGRGCNKLSRGAKNSRESCRCSSQVGRTIVRSFCPPVPLPLPAPPPAEPRGAPGRAPSRRKPGLPAENSLTPGRPVQGSTQHATRLLDQAGLKTDIRPPYGALWRMDGARAATQRAMEPSSQVARRQSALRRCNASWALQCASQRGLHQAH